MSERYIVPSPESDFSEMTEVPVELSRRRQIQGRLFRKEILRKGPLIHPLTGKTVDIDDAFIARMTDNFRSGVVDIVQVPVADSENRHTEDPTRNIGEVVDIQESGGKIYAVIDARNEQAADNLGKTLLGASAMLHTDYKSDKTGKRVGPTLMHVCVTNRPYVTGLDDYQEIVQAAADTSGDVVMLTAAAPELKESEMPTLDELIQTLKDEHGIDVTALRSEADAATKLTSSLLSQLQEAGLVKLTGSESDQITTEDVVGAVAELAATNTTLQGRVESLEQRNAEASVQKLVDDGFIMPAQKDVFVELKLSNTDMFAKLVPDKPLVKMDDEQGGAPPADEAHQKNIDDEIARLTAEVEKL